jgi:hypothetical protein
MISMFDCCGKRHDGHSQQVSYLVPVHLPLPSRLVVACRLPTGGLQGQCRSLFPAGAVVRRRGFLRVPPRGRPLPAGLRLRSRYKRAETGGAPRAPRVSHAWSVHLKSSSRQRTTLHYTPRDQGPKCGVGIVFASDGTGGLVVKVRSRLWFRLSLLASVCVSLLAFLFMYVYSHVRCMHTYIHASMQACKQAFPKP